MSMLESINGVDDLRRLSPEDLKVLASEVRDYIIQVVSQNGGHLASSLGVVELTLALHYVFNTPEDRLIWDVGHQSYAHKIITGRRDEFRTLRKHGGLSGFPKVNESLFDTFDVGHSSTSLSLALGEAVGRDLQGQKHKVVAIIGDGSLTGGVAFESLNHIGHLQQDLIIILNDNEHSISKNVGALSRYLTRMISNSFYNRVRRKTMQMVRRIPRFGNSIFNFLYRFFGSFKGMLIIGRLFEDMGVRYFGPVDGHDIPKLIDLLSRVKDINAGPKLVHVITKKGKGYLPAELDPALFHGIGPFDRITGKTLGITRTLSYSEVAGQTLSNIALFDDRVVAITAAMKLGTGLVDFEHRAPERFFDVGIAEQHAITFAAALAKTGMKPFVSIYSTFLQRAIDQIIHDVAIMKLPVRILVDRAGIVGDDGETHHGVFDLALLRSIPGIILLAPSNGEELRDMIHFAVSYNDGPVAIRYPRGRISTVDLPLEFSAPFVPGRAVRLSRGNDCAIFAVGDMVKTALEVRDILKERGLEVSVVNLLSLKPLDAKLVNRVASETGCFITLENGVIAGGIGEAVSGLLSPDHGAKLLFHAGFTDTFVTHGTNAELFHDYGLDAPSLASRIEKQLGRPKRKKR